MKPATRILFFVLLLPVFLQAQTGADCSTAIPLTMDGVCRIFPTSSSTGNPFLCTSYASGTPVTYFTFTTNAIPDRVQMKITSPNADACEVLLYTSSSCTPPISSSSMCFDDGTGIWAPSHFFSYLPNTTYFIRVKTNSAGNITICASNYTPPNDNCAGALNIGPTPITDNNATHTAGPDVFAADLCGSTLENTAFYKYTVASTGVSIINLNNIQCDNGATNNSNGFQVGFFTGTCGTLIPINCFSGLGSFVTATTNILTAGTQVVVAIDGTAGANCSYEINAINALVLSADIKNFNAWKNSTANLLTWTTVSELRNDYFDIERSTDGISFIKIGKVNGQLASYTDRTYEFNDAAPPPRSYYRLKQVNKSGESSYYNTILVIRNNQSGFQLNFQNPVKNDLQLNFYSPHSEQMKLRIIAANGKIIKEEIINCNTGPNSIVTNVSYLSAAVYLLELTSSSVRTSKLFLKENTGN